VLPGKSKTATFQAMYPGAFIYHCAVPDMDVHMARGMFGMIVVEPEEGLPRVDREFYIGQNETYTKQRPGTPGTREFDFDAILREDPSYVIFNGAFNVLTRERFGVMHAEVGESVRVFMVNSGPTRFRAFIR
jgi:nitrite reductase (NO-forming)